MNKTITVYNDESCCRPSKLVEYIDWLKEQLNEIPEEFRNSARVNISAYGSYGDGCFEYTISYDRPETDSERESREFKELERQKSELARVTAEFERLKKKLNQ